MQEILDETLNELPTGESEIIGASADFPEDDLELHEFGGIESSDPKSVYNNDDDENDQDVGITIEQFKELKRKQRLDRITESSM